MSLRFNREKFRKDLVIKRVVEKNLSIEEVAEITKVPASVLSGIESGNVPLMGDFTAICDFMESKRPGGYFVQEEEVIQTEEDETAGAA